MSFKTKLFEHLPSARNQFHGFFHAAFQRGLRFVGEQKEMLHPHVMMAGQVIDHLICAKGMTGEDDVRIALPLRKGQTGAAGLCIGGFFFLLTEKDAVEYNRMPLSTTPLAVGTSSRNIMPVPSL